MSDKNRRSEDERAPELKTDSEAQLDELGTDPGQVGENSAGQAGDTQALSSEEDATEESVEELADTEQALEGTLDSSGCNPGNTRTDIGEPLYWSYELEA